MSTQLVAHFKLSSVLSPKIKEEGEHMSCFLCLFNGKDHVCYSLH